jgi:hypothetical protein
MKRQRQKRLIFTLPEPEYNKLRKIAFKRNESMSIYIFEALKQRLEKDHVS